MKALAPMALVLLAAVGQAQTVRTVLSNGATANRYDLVVLGDGYTAAEQSRFDADVLAFSTALFQKEPYRTFASYYNVHSVFRPSQQSGANHPDVTPPILRNPVYGATYNFGGTGRCLYITNTALAAQDAALAPANEGRVIVLVNDSRYGGCGGTFSVSYNGSQMTEVQIHEMGHSIGGLADEYVTFSSTYTGPEPAQPNATLSSTGQKWSLWHGFNGVSAFEGARYYRFGLFRPRIDCLMRSLGVPNCPICSEQLTLVTNRVVSAIDQPSPAAASLTLNAGSRQTFSFANIAPAGSNATVTWRVDGVAAAATGTSLVLDTTGMALGPHTVEVEVADRTPLVRNDPQQVMQHSHRWDVTVFDPTVPDLRADQVRASTLWASAGQAIGVSTTVTNDSQVPAGAFDIDLFLSADTTFTAADIFLGSTTIPGLAPGQTATFQRGAVVLPARMTATPWYVGAVLDRTDRVREQNEGNNTAFTVILGTAPPCTPALEFRDPLVYPPDRRTVDLVGGGTALPTVVAPCAAAGTQYVIVWGCSGTNPGTTVAPGVTVPINQDLCTQFGLWNLNGPVFQQFWGTLGPGGIGNATFQWPGAAVAPMSGHFAALLLDGTPAFTGATNPIAIDLR